MIPADHPNAPTSTAIAPVVIPLPDVMTLLPISSATPESPSKTPPASVALIRHFRAAADAIAKTKIGSVATSRVANRQIRRAPNDPDGKERKENRRAVAVLG